ncbi:MAG TPA: ParA family protein [Stellaceae bacterium]|nr:ParA family protein [Stellaceae bacterium]
MGGAILVLATQKGGSGKSTAAACLAVHADLGGKRVALIDADPQASLLHWRSLGEPPLDLRIDAEPSEAVGSHARRLAEGCDLVIIDTAGFRNRTMIEALSVADLALVPIKPSPLDIAAALETVKLIGEVNHVAERAGRQLRYRLFLTQVTVGSVIARHVRAELKEAGLALLTAELANRVAYGEATLRGRMPAHLDAQGPAAREGAGFADEVLAALKP